MRICLISTEIFAWGKYGGFGRAARTIGRELVRRGFEVCAVVPRRPGQRAVERLDGMTVYGFPPYRPWRAAKLFRRCDAEVYHSCEVSLGSAIAMFAMPRRRHMATFRDPRNLRDWKLEFDRPSLSRLQVLRNFVYEGNPLVGWAVRRMDAHYTIGHDLIPKVRGMYRLAFDPGFLPTPVAVPHAVRKARRPTVCYVARLDRRKRPERFLELARRFPHVRFIAVGGSRDRRWEASLRARFAHLPNLEMTGFIDQFGSSRHARVLERSWVMVNAATREAMPNSFLEAAAHRCAILSRVDPDGFASRFGYHARDDDLAAGLDWLLKDRRWEGRGERGAAHVTETFEMRRAMEDHVAAYRGVVTSRLPRRVRAAAGPAHG